ncbi:hypothetical protein IIZ81_01305 [Candidatus Saccharibacteria bacterium]|nr:hypothetical protein [Candidatus Saccharibacteria bacterium]
MSTTKLFLETVIAKLDKLPLEITSRPMMGEYLLYADGVLFGGLYDNRFLIKKTSMNQAFDLPEAIPYSNTKKTMYQIEDLDNPRLTKIINATIGDLISCSRSCST